VNRRVRIEEISKPSAKLSPLRKEDFKPLPGPLSTPEATPDFKLLSPEIEQRCEATLDDTLVLNLPKPKTREEEDRLVASFLSGLQKLFTKENNWTFLEP
jgi:hypothetical protein